MTYRLNSVRYSSLRWLGSGWDSFWKKKDYLFIQFGSKPVKFVLIPFCLKNKLPTFLLTGHWETRILFKGIRIGITKKPFKFVKPKRRKL
jgi:hypothetical protein